MSVKLPVDDRRIWPLAWAGYDAPRETPVLYGKEVAAEYRGEWFKVTIGIHDYNWQEGDRCSLYHGWARTKLWHPVSAIIQFLRLSRFSHISVEQAAAPLRTRPNYHVGRWSEDDVMIAWAREYGLYCWSCRKVTIWSVGEEIDDEWRPDAPWWKKDEICQRCALESKEAAVSRQTRDIAREIEFKRAQAKKRKAQEERREAADANYKLRKQAELKERERQRVEMLAAYELVKELGLIDKIRKERHNEAGKAA